MPEGLRKHVRYPELFVGIQARMYATYHVENEQVFYNREDIWTLAQQGRGQGTQQTSDAIEPFYILMSFPGDSKLEFVAILPFTPANRNNLIGWLGARSDGDTYGKLRGYHFPKTKFVDGPLQVQARIDQNPQLSSQLTLWNQQGSKVIRGIRVDTSRRHAAFCRTNLPPGRTEPDTRTASCCARDPGPAVLRDNI